MLEITLEHTIWEKYMEAQVFPNSEEKEFLRRIDQHTIIVSDVLLDLEEKKFAGQSGLEELFKTFIANFNQSEINAKFIDVVNASYSTNKLDEYQNYIVNLCLASDDKILLTNSRKILSMKSSPVNSISYDMVMGNKVDNIFSKYTLPIHTNINKGEESKKHAEWLGRFFKGEKYIEIHDNYICSLDNIKNFKKYILKYIEENADVDIYTIVTDNISREDIKREFEKEEYHKWNLSVFLAPSKKEHHARDIVTNKYVIRMDRGISAFGNNGEMFQSLIDIYDIKEKQYNGYGKDAEQIL